MCLAQSSRHRRGNLSGPGSVAVNAQRLRVHANFAPVARNHYPLLGNAKRLPRRFFGIADQRVLKFARAQCSIRLITPVSECLSSYGKSSLAKNVQHRRSRQADQHDILAPSSDAFSNRLRKLAIAHRLIVERTMRLDVRQPGAATCGSFRKRANLFEHGICNRFARHLQLQSPEIRAIRIARMRANRQLPAQRLLDRCLHGSFVASMPSAIASGSSPISQFKSIFAAARFIRIPTPPTPENLPDPATALAPLPARPVRIESHPAGEAAPGYENPLKSHWQSSDIPP